MSRYLGYQATHWNRIADHSESRRFVEAYIHRRLFRAWLPGLSGNQLKVYLFVISRTLSWQKYAEAIPIRHFISGIQEPDGSLYKDDEGVPACSGTGICKEDTVRDALSFLRTKGFISVFPGKRGTVTAANVYLPLAENLLAAVALRGGCGVLPEHMSMHIAGEHVWYEGDVWRITSVEIDALGIRPVSRWGDMTGKTVYVADDSVERVRLDEWKAFKAGEEATDHTRSV